MRGLLAAAVAAAALVAPTAARADIDYFNLPAGLSPGTGLDVSPDGIVYFGTEDFTAAYRPAVMRFDPALGQASMTPLFTPAGTGFDPIRDVAYSPKNGIVYWTRSDDTVGKIDNGVASSVAVPVSPWGIAATSDGGAWFSEWGAYSPTHLGDRVSHLDANLGLNEGPNIAVQSGNYDLRYNVEPQGITVGADDTPWFAEASAGNPGYRIGHLVGMTYTEYQPPCGTGNPCSGSNIGLGLTELDLAADGTVWYSNVIKHSIEHLDPVSKVITSYALSSISPTLASSTPEGVRVAPDGSVWLAVYKSDTSSTGNALVKLVPGVSSTVYDTGGFAPWDVVADRSGTVWFTGSKYGTQVALGRLTGASTPVATPTPQPTPSAPATTTITTPPATTSPLVPSSVGTAHFGDPTVHGTSLSTNQICVGPPQDVCSVVYLIQTHEYVTGLPGSKNAFAAKTKTVTIGKANVTLKGGQSKKVTIKLNATGRKLLKKGKKLKATLTVSQSVTGSKKPKTVFKRNVAFK